MNKDEQYIIGGNTVSSIVELLASLKEGVENNKFLYSPSEYGYTIFAYEQTINELLSLNVVKTTKKQERKARTHEERTLKSILNSLNVSLSVSGSAHA